MRIATFNLESLDQVTGAETCLGDRIEMLRPQLLRLDADILCLQEVNGQRLPGQPHRTLAALDALLAGTPYAKFERRTTTGPSGEGVVDVHNVVTLSRFAIVGTREIRNTLVPALSHAYLNADPPLSAQILLPFDRPALLTDHRLDDGSILTIVNVHLRSPLAMPVPGQKAGPFVWKSASAWAEGFHLSAVKRSAQALEIRMTIDRLLDEELHRLIVVLGDFNAEDHDTPLRILAAGEDDTGNGHLGPRTFTALDRSLPVDRRYSVLHHGRPEMLDHILASRAALANFRLIEAHNETLTDETIGYAKTRHSAGSYHAPVVAEFASPQA